jgi:hypothetical protein
LKVAHADLKRDLYFKATAPTLGNEVGDDVRVLAVDLKRGPLPSLDTVKAALVNTDTPDAVEGLRRVLLETITGDGDLPRLLEAPELKILRDRLMKLTVQPDNPEDNAEVILLFHPY